MSSLHDSLPGRVSEKTKVEGAPPSLRAFSLWWRHLVPDAVSLLLVKAGALCSLDASLPGLDYHYS